MQISDMIRLIFTQYMLFIIIFCGVIISFVYPLLLKGRPILLEYKIGKYAGYAYIAFGLSMYVVNWFLA